MILSLTFGCCAYVHGILYMSSITCIHRNGSVCCDLLCLLFTSKARSHLSQLPNFIVIRNAHSQIDDSPVDPDNCDLWAMISTPDSKTDKELIQRTVPVT
jgi:hypothetical protein